MSQLDITVILAMLLLEFLNPRAKYKFFKKGFFEDLFFAFLIIFVLPRIYQFFPVSFDAIRGAFHWGGQNINYWGQFLICLIVGDFLLFVLHFCMHRFEFMWKVHKLHHSSKEVSLTSAFRNGYGEDLFMLIAIMVPFHLLKFDHEVIRSCFTVFAFHGYFLHSNINVRMPSFLKFIGCPHFHQWHHEIKILIPGGQNFGATFTIWDRIFKKYVFPELSPLNFGLYDNEEMKGNLITQYLGPFVSPFLYIFEYFKKVIK